MAAMYCKAFRLFLIICFLLTCITYLIRKNTSEIVMIMLVTIFGCCVFHSFWETSTWYSAPFILPMLVVDEDGIATLQERFDETEMLRAVPWRAPGFVLMGFLLVVCACLNSALKKETTLNFYRVYSSENIRYSKEIVPADFTRLEQDFYTEKPFNSLFIKASLPEQTPQEDSGYGLTILNDDGQVLFQSLLLPQQLGGSGFQVSIDPISGYSHYHVRMGKTEPEKKSVLFYTQYTYGLNPYRGELTVNGGTPYPSDLIMDVFQTQKTAVYGKKVRIILTALILSSGALIAFVPIRKQKCN